MKYGLRRGRQWISAPQGDGRPIPPVLAIADNRADAWLLPSIDDAIEIQHLLRMCWGWTTEVRAVR